MDVEVRELAPDRVHHGGVVLAGEGRMDPSLEAHLGRAAIPGLPSAPDDLLVWDEVGRAAEVRRQLPLRERAEAAAEVADVRVLDVPRHDVGDLVAADLAAQAVGGGEDTLALVGAGSEEANELVLPQPVARVDRERVARDDEWDAVATARMPVVLAGQAER